MLKEKLKDWKEKFTIAIDPGNNAFKFCFESNSNEDDLKYDLLRIPAFYSIKDMRWYEENTSITNNSYRCIYNGTPFLIGKQGDSTIDENKGDANYIDYVRAIIFTGISTFMKRKGINKAEFNVMTATPTNKHDEYEQDYIDMLLTPEPIKIEVDGEEYEIAITRAAVTKQGAVAMALIDTSEDKNGYIFFDWGGGQLDLGYYVDGVLKGYKTINLPLNQELEKLGIELNKHKLKLPNPDQNDGYYMSIIEDVVVNGKYFKTDNIIIDNKEIKIKDFVKDWFLPFTNKVKEQTRINFNIQEAIAEETTAYHLGGGVHLFFDSIMENTVFPKVKRIENPGYATVIASYNIAVLLPEEKWVEVE